MSRGVEGTGVWRVQVSRGLKGTDDWESGGYW